MRKRKRDEEHEKEMVREEENGFRRVRNVKEKKKKPHEEIVKIDEKFFKKIPHKVMFFFSSNIAVSPMKE